MKKMLSLFYATSFLLIGVFPLLKCSKDYSYEGGLISGNTSGTAAFAFVGEGAACTGRVVSGNYYADSVLAATNTVQLQVHVTSIGSYSVNTSSLDGFQFTGSGNFTDTGVQTIKLTGVGKPISEGNFTFTTPMGVGCTFTVVVTKVPMVMAGFTLAGGPNACQNPEIDGSYFYGSQFTTSNIVIVNVIVTSVGAYNLSTDTVNGIYFSTSGIFTKTGAQTVKLLGYGTPVMPNNLVFTPHNGNTSCTFKITVVSPGPPATYVLQSGLGNCQFSVTGNYFTNTPLTHTNNVSILVYVTVAGNFSIATNTVNGMSFSYTGTFSTLGTQNVILYGVGTPNNSGTFSFTPQIIGPAPIGGASCDFNIKVQ